MGIARIEIDLQTMLCGNCNAPYAVVQVATQICPYCAADMIATDRIDWGKIRSKLKVEIARLKRSNASLRGVITKLKNKENQADPVKVVSKDDVDLKDPDNFLPRLSNSGTKCEGCEYRKINGDCPSYFGRFYCSCTEEYVLKLKPEHRHMIGEK